MPRQSLALADISDFDLNLAKHDRALTAAAEIRTLAPEDRQRRRNELHDAIAAGTASLFEERVLTVLLEPQGAERILAIQRHLPHIERARATRSAAQPGADAPPIAAPPPPSESPATGVDAKAAGAPPYQSELLDFIASQKPPTPPLGSGAPKTPRSVRSASDTRTEAGWSRRDQAVVAGLVALLGLAIGYRLLSDRAADAPLLTFDQQARQHEAALGRPALPAEAQAEFDAAMQGLRSGDFEQAQAQLLALIARHPASPQAESGYMALADTQRQRQNDPDQALRYYQTLLEHFPRSPNAGLTHLKMGFAYEDLDDAANAGAMYRLVLDRHGSQSRIGQLAGQRLNQLASDPSLPEESSREL